MDPCTYICITQMHTTSVSGMQKPIEDKGSDQLGVIPGDHIRIKAIFIKTSHIKETKRKQTRRRANQERTACRAHGMGDGGGTQMQDAQPLSISSYINSNHMDIVLFLHENGKNPERTITYSAGEAPLSYR